MKPFWISNQGHSHDTDTPGEHSFYIPEGVYPDPKAKRHRFLCARNAVLGMDGVICRCGLEPEYKLIVLCPECAKPMRYINCRTDFFKVDGKYGWGIVSVWGNCAEHGALMRETKRDKFSAKL